MEISQLLTELREDHLSDTFDGWEDASDEDKNSTFLWTDKQLIRYLDTAQEEACRRGDVLFSTTAFPIKLVEGTKYFEISPLITRIERITLDGDTNVPHVSPYYVTNELQRNQSLVGFEGNMVVWLAESIKEIQISPAPALADVGRILNIEAYHIPLNALTCVNSQIDIPSSMHRDLMWYALFLAYSKMDAETYDPKRAAMYAQKFEQKFGPEMDHRTLIHQRVNNRETFVGGVDYLSNADMRETAKW